MALRAIVNKDNTLTLEKDGHVIHVLHPSDLYGLLAALKKEGHECIDRRGTKDN